MPLNEHVREAFERNVKAMQLKPSIAQGTATTSCRITDGVTCEVTEGSYTMITDEPKSEGGDDRGPTPGFLIRGGLGSCYAISLMIRAAVDGVPIDSLEVEIEADYDSRGSYGVADVPRGFKEVRYIVKVQSPAPEADVLKVLDGADAMSTMLAVARNPTAMKREVEFVATAA